MSKLLNEKTVNKDGYFSAKQALYSGNETEFKKYLEERVNVEKYHNELLNFAIMGSRFNIVKELLKNKNVQNGGNLDHIVSKAVNYGTKEDVTYMIEFKASIVQRKYDITEELLKYESIDPTANNYDGLSVLINRGEIDIIEKILKDERVKASKNKKRIYEKILTFSRCTLKEKIKIKSMLEEHGFQNPNKRKPKIFKS